MRLEFEVTLSSLGAMNPVISSEYEKNQNVLQNIISLKKYEVIYLALFLDKVKNIINPKTYKKLRFQMAQKKKRELTKSSKCFMATDTMPSKFKHIQELQI